ncbi:MAG TPA: hypothetical protein VFD43_01695 [Planctomycetota bacterium]|nr:hypothetical protein [Planctomycetota bacterium]
MTCFGLGQIARLARLGSIAAALLAPSLAGCGTLGPGSISRDRLAYDNMVTESWKRQMLLNLVKLRYGDAPLFVDVTSIINSYALEGDVTLAAQWQDGGAPDSRGAGVAARFAEKPTITYSPMQGARFTRSLMTPLSPAIVISLVQAGWSADPVFRLMVTSVNGVRNRCGFGVRARAADPEFRKLIDALRRIQASGAMGMRVNRTGENEATVVTLLSRQESETFGEDSATVREILGVEQGLSEFQLVYGSTGGPDEVAMITRSMLEILLDVAAWGDVPELHITEGRVAPTNRFETDERDGFRPLVNIRTSESEPEDAFVSVPYRNHWFYVDDRDLMSKNIFTMLLIMFSLTETDAGAAPVVTIPAN